MSRRSRLMFMLGLACVLAATPAVASAKAGLPFYSIGKTIIPLPHTVQPWLPGWSPDGRHIVFENQANGRIWTATSSGHGVSCITCTFSDDPKITPGGFHLVFRDERRLFVSHGLGSAGGVDSGPNADAYVLECTPSLYACRSHRYLPVDMSEDKVGNPVIVQRRTWHLAPDGVHLAWMEVRLGATLMIVGKLQREADKYMVVDQRVVDPPGPTSLTSTNPVGWANAGQLYELKSFADGGRSIIAVGEPQGNPDTIKINLATGHITQLTHNLAWDEDGAISPDGQLYGLQSARERPGVQALGWIPQLEPFFDYPLSSAVILSGNRWINYQCNLSPWLLPASGDHNARLVGQPLETYPVSGGLTAGDELIGQQMWSPDSTEVLLQDSTRKRPPAGSSTEISQQGLTPPQLAVAHIRRRPTEPLPTVSSNVGSWAPAPQDYASTINSNATMTADGQGGGSADLTYRGSIATGRWSVTYHHYSRDGRTFLDGTETLTGSPTSALTLTASITVAGAHTGRLDANLTFHETHGMTGQYTAIYDGHHAPPITITNPDCYRYLPHTSPLSIQIRHIHGAIAVTVTATIDAQHRPVSGALLHLSGRQAITGTDGRAQLRPPSTPGRVRLTITAGSTFRPTSRLISP